MITTIIKHISKTIRLIAVEQEAKETYTFKFSVPQGVTWTPGSYAHFVCSDLQGGQKFKKNLLHELSIMSHPDEGFIAFTTRIRKNPSEFKQRMLKLEVGDDIRMFKIGNHFKTQHTDKPLVYISTGVGIATFRSMIMKNLNDDDDVTSLVTNINIDRTGDFVYHKEFEALADGHLKNVLVTSREDLYSEINQCINDSQNIYYIVGSKVFNDAIGEYLLKNKVSKESIVFDKH